MAVHFGGESTGQAIAANNLSDVVNKYDGAKNLGVPYQALRVHQTVTAGGTTVSQDWPVSFAAGTLASDDLIEVLLNVVNGADHAVTVSVNLHHAVAGDSPCTVAVDSGDGYQGHSRIYGGAADTTIYQIIAGITLTPTTLSGSSILVTPMTGGFDLQLSVTLPAGTGDCEVQITVLVYRKA